jgi:predicted transcriptional regulator
MKKIVVMCVIGLWTSGSFAKLSCGELDELATSLDDLAEVLVSVEEIGLNSELDGALGTVTDVLTEVARVENDARLTRWIADLKLAWNDMEREDFEDSLDDIIERLDELAERDCSDW